MNHDVSFSKFWKIRCIMLDIVDYLEEGGIDHLEDAIYDLPILKKVLEDELEAKKKWMMQKK